jgi:cell division protein FtsI (penicillin-binding protein 3)
MEAKKEILLRTYFLYTLLCFLGIAICVRVFFIQHVQGAKWKKEEANFTTSFRTIEAVRGNIYAEDGNLLATSLPYFDVAMDVNTEYLTDDIFNSGIDSLSIRLSSLFKDKTENEYYKLLKAARDNGDRYVMIHHSVSYDDLQKLKHFPLFRLGKYKGGLITVENNRRELPFRDLAERTIGYERANVQPVGMEGAYDSYLTGVNGQGLMEKTAGGVWVPVDDNENLQPQNGCDLISTINVNYQDVAENALRTQLMKHHAEHGCVVLMEVKTGRVLAIANLTRRDTTGTYEEMYNYATGESMEPGSTFKLFSLLVAMEDGLVNPTDTINLENGSHIYYDRVMKDAEHHQGEGGNVSVQRAFELSSNVGISKVIYKHYASQPQKFVDGLCRLGINQPLHLSISGEGNPSIPSPGNSNWYGTSLPWLSVGYGLTITPLQTLVIYNAVANNGVMVKPQFVDEITKDGKQLKKFDPVIMNPSICSSSTLKKLRSMLEGVVLRGTASNLKSTVYSIAGKTGTAQIASKGQYKVESKANYRASFVGYFPADNPLYSCIVIVNSPSTDGYYGNITAGPIFREIADKVYASSITIDPSIDDTSHKAINNNLFVKNGDANDTYKVFKALDVNCKSPSGLSPWLEFAIQDTTLTVNDWSPEKQLEKGIIPDLKNMNAEDAVYLLESAHLKVSVKGSGAVKEQSLEPGTIYVKGQRITLKLS